MAEAKTHAMGSSPASGTNTFSPPPPSVTSMVSEGQKNIVFKNAWLSAVQLGLLIIN